MKNKKSLYILIPLVAIVWGLIIFRIIKMTQNDAYVLPQQSKAYVKKDSIVIPKLKKLNLNYPDPFLKKEAISGEMQEKEFHSLFYNNPEPEKTKVEWPDIVYKGMVENGKAMLGVVEIDKKRHLLSAQDQMEELTLIKIYTDSIIFEKKNEQKTFYK